MPNIKEHSTLLRDLVNHHAKNINGKQKRDEVVKSICDSCVAPLDTRVNSWFDRLESSTKKK
jgi:hypothetical protein